jgi:GntR family transcriptional repressor for pyruvate dehydrogenase complex
MLEQYQIARSTLREALRLLEFQGVIALKSGPGGGPVLLDPDGSSLANAMILFMQFKQAPFRAIVEVRAGIEPMISALAAQRVTDEQLDELRQTIDEMSSELDNQNVFLDANKRFHEVVANSSGNALFGCIADSLLGIMDGTALGVDYPRARRVAILDAHISILEALRERDPKKAQDRMADHIDAYLRYAEKRYPELLDQVIEWDRITG